MSKQKASSTSSNDSSTELLIQFMREQADREEEREKEREKSRLEEAKRHEQFMLTMAQALGLSSTGVPAQSNPNLGNQAPSGTPTVPTQLSRRAGTIAAPSPLSPDATLRQYKTWRTSWDDYAVVNCIASLPLRTQLAYLRSCLTEDMQGTLAHTLGITESSTVPLPDILEKIDTHMKQQRGQILRRLQFTQCRQEVGESFESFYVKLKQCASDADLCAQCVDVRLLDAVVAGITDADLRKRLLAEEPAPTLQQGLSLCRSHEAAEKTKNELPGQKQQVQAISKYKQAKQVNFKKKGKGQEADKHQDRIKTEYKCFRCGGAERHELQQCPAKGKICGICGIKNHISSVCRSKEKHKFKKGTANPSSTATRRITVGGMSSSSNPVSGGRDPCPLVSIKIQHGDISRQLLFCPDTGSNSKCIGIQHLCTLGLRREQLLPP